MREQMIKEISTAMTTVLTIEQVAMLKQDTDRGGEQV